MSSKIRILRAADHRRMPWKNGGGVTTEIAVHPDGAGLADFGWRISMATVASDGPFSIFPAIDRTLSILEGGGIALSIDGRRPITLTQASPPLFFAADVPVSATLVEGPITDLNVMTRRDGFEHRVERLAVTGSAAVETAGTATLFLAQAPVSLTQGDETVRLEALDCALFDGSSGAVRIEADSAAVCYRIVVSAI